MSAVQNRAQNEGKNPGQEMLNLIKGIRNYGKQYNPDFVDINPPQIPVISIDKTRFYFGVLAGGNAPGSRRFTISNSGAGTLNWSIIDNAAWLSSNPTSGTGSAQVTVSIDITGLNPGDYTGIITVSDPNASNSPQTVEITLNVYEQGADNEPFGSFDTPADGSSVRSSVAVTGWVLDDIGIDRVEIYRGGENREDWIYIGDAVLVEGARTDIEQTFPTYPMNHKAGWGYMMLTNFLPNGGNGIFIIYARATDTSGHSVTLGSKTITCDNANAVKPFGAIDTPTQGGTASGSNFAVWGWALTPWPNTIPTDGSSINVYVDGVNLGHTDYNIYRPDIAGLFPSYANSSGAAGYFILDTTTYENGVHTIQWVVTDGGGNTDGIGSRYFVIQNSK